MKKAIKSVLAITLALAMVLSTIGVSAAYETTQDGYIQYDLAAASVTLNDATNGATIDVPITISQAKGIIGYTITLKFDPTYLDFPAPDGVTTLKWPFKEPTGMENKLTRENAANVNCKDADAGLKQIIIQGTASTGFPWVADTEDILVGTLTFTVKGSPAAGTRVPLTWDAGVSATNLSAVKAAEATASYNAATMRPIAIAAGENLALTNGSITLGQAAAGTKTLVTTTVGSKNVPLATEASALELPATVEFDVDDDSTLAGVEVDWNTTNYTADACGQVQAIEGTPKNLPDGYEAGEAKAIYNITVNKGTVQEVVNADPITVPFNTSWAYLQTLLPTNTTVIVQETGTGFVMDLDADWSESQYNPTTVGAQTLTTTIPTSHNQVDVNGQNFSVVVTVEQGALDANWTFEDAGAEFLNSLTQTIPVGTELAASGLPSTIPVSIPEYAGSVAGNAAFTANLPITWSDYDSQKDTVGQATINGTIGGTDQVAVPTNNTITATVTFEGETEKVTIGAENATVYTGDDFVLPIMIKNADAIEGGVRGVSFTINYDATIAHETIKGVREPGETDFTALVVGTPITIGNTIAVNAAAAGVVNIALADAAGETVYTEEEETIIELQFAAKADYNDVAPSAFEITVTDAQLVGDNYNPTTDYEAMDAVITILPLQVAYVKDDAFTKVTVLPGTTKEELASTLATQYANVDVELAAVTSVEAQIVGFGGASVAADAIYRKDATASITWDTTTFDPASDNEQTIYGTISIGADAQDGVDNIAVLKAEVVVQVAALEIESVQGSPFAVSVRHLDVAEDAAIAAYLPATVTVVLEGGSTRTVPVVWTRTTQGGWNANGQEDVIYEFEGALDLTGITGVLNTSEVTAAATLTFTDNHVISEVTDILKYLAKIPGTKLDSTANDYDEEYATWVDVNENDRVDIGDAVKIVDIVLGLND